MISIGYLDIAVIVYLVIMALVGLLKGFSKKSLWSFGFAMGWLVAYLIGNTISHALLNTTLANFLQQWYQGMLPKTDIFVAEVTTSASARVAQYSQALSEIHIPTFFHGLFTNRVIDTSSTVGAAVASSFAYFTIIIGTFIVLFLLTAILIFIIFHHLWGDDSLFGADGRSFFGRIIGMVKNVSVSTLQILAVFAIVSLLNQILMKNGNSAINDFLIRDLSMDDPAYFSLARMFYNTASSLFEWISIPTL